MQKFLGLLTCFLFFYPISSIYGDVYNLEIDEHSFDISYFFDGNVIKMEIDQELKSLLIATQNVNDSIFEINFRNELLNAENNEFAVLINGYEIDYQVSSEGKSTKLSFFIPAFTEEIEIIGTHVIPEFPIGILFTFLIMTSMVILLTKSKLSIIR